VKCLVYLYFLTSLNTGDIGAYAYQKETESENG